jgi:hypothetical protein
MKTTGILSRVLIGAALVASTISCGDVVRSSRSPVMLVVNSLTATRGSATSSTAASALVSDVLTIVTTGGTCTTTNPCPTIFGDTGTLTLSLAFKDTAAQSQATTNNQVTVNRIHVAYRRTDGRNQEGVDVPFAFDTASTALVPTSGTTAIGFNIVRNQAKSESPLAELVNNGQIISAIIDVTAYGTDQVGNAVSVTGSIGVSFGNFGDQ